MSENNPEIVNKLYQEARILSTMTPLAQPPGISHSRPETSHHRRKYTIHQLKEAVDLAAKIGVKEAAKATGVSYHSIYKEAHMPRVRGVYGAKTIADTLYKLDHVMSPTMTSMVKMARMALYNYANLRGVAGSGGSTLKRDCFRRVALRFNVNPNVLWNEYRQNKIQGVHYDK